MLVYYLVVFCGEAQSCAVTLSMARWMEPCLAINHSLVSPWASEYKVTSASRESATQGSSRFGRFVWPWAHCLHLSDVLHSTAALSARFLLHVPLNEAATNPKQRPGDFLFDAFCTSWVNVCFCLRTRSLQAWISASSCVS